MGTQAMATPAIHGLNLIVPAATTSDMGELASLKSA
jgi:hypothetical protein